MKFIDHIDIGVRSGDGGSGMVSFRAARNLPKLGADGGDGGHGGNVYFEGRSALSTLSHLFFKRTYKAAHGEKGGSNGRTGASGDDMIIPVPLGTVVTNKDTGDTIAEVMVEGGKYMVAKGGRRGLGNLRYLSSTHQAPEEFKEGEQGIYLSVHLELKLIADVGLAGFPNAGKSTLLSCLSAARPKVADYPFTTLEPQLGVVSINDEEEWAPSFVMADIPGLIEGASDGRGLGLDFLRHLERTKIVLYVLDGSAPLDGPDPIEAFEKLQLELKKYSLKLYEKPVYIVITKSDLWGDDGIPDELIEPFRNLGVPVAGISSVAGRGLTELKRSLYKMVLEEGNRVHVDSESMEKVETESSLFNHPSEYRQVVRSDRNSHLGL